MLTFRGRDCPLARYIWDRIIHKRHRVFLWLALKDRHHMRDNMLRKKWTRLIEHNGCDLCPAAKTMHHILLRCKLAQVVWAKARLLDSTSSTETAADFLASGVAREASGALWHGFFAAGAVALCHARNAQVFHKVCWTAGKVLTEIAQLLMLWKLRAPGGNARELLTSWANVMLQQ